MPKLSNIVNSAINDVKGNVNHTTLDACIKALANNNVSLCKKGEFTPLSEADIRGLNPDLGALGMQDQLQQCMGKFDEMGFEKCQVQKASESVKETLSNLVDGAKDALHSAADTVTPGHSEL